MRANIKYHRAIELASIYGTRVYIDTVHAKFLRATVKSSVARGPDSKSPLHWRIFTRQLKTFPVRAKAILHPLQPSTTAILSAGAVHVRGTIEKLADRSCDSDDEEIVVGRENEKGPQERSKAGKRRKSDDPAQVSGMKWPAEGILLVPPTKS